VLVWMSVAVAAFVPFVSVSVVAPPFAHAQSTSTSASSSSSASSAALPPDPSASAAPHPLADVPVGGLAPSASASPRPPSTSSDVDVPSLIPLADLAVADSFAPPPTGPRENFVPALLRSPDVALGFDASMLLRVSPGEARGIIPEATTHGFRTESPHVPIGSGGVLVGVGAGMSIVWGNRFIFPAISLDFAHSLGARARVLSGESGAVLSAETWTTYQVGATLLGVGIRGRHRHWAGSLLLEPGFVGQSTNVRASVYDGEATARAQAFSGRLLVTANACRRVDPTLRVCLSVSPHVYALGFGNGVTFGFRTEIGP
jgi:hypothetical protein